MDTMEEADAFLLLNVQAIAVLYSQRRRRHRRDSYVRDIFARRWEQGDFHNLVRELGDHAYFSKYFRFTPPLLEELLQLVGPALLHHNTHRTPIGPKERLVMTLR
jgi:hypothetical protein